MEHGGALVATVAIAVAAAFVGGWLARLAHVPVIVGYLLAGIAVGPYTPGLVADTATALELAEIGVVLMMFGVGLHFSVRDLLAVRRIAVPGAIGQIAVATGLGFAVGLASGWSGGASAVLGLAIAVASTVVLLRALDDHHLLAAGPGRVAVGWLIVEDIVTVVALVVLPTFAPHAEAASAAAVAGDVVLAIVKAAALAALILGPGSRLLPWGIARVERSGSRELFTLAVLAVSIGLAAAATAVFGVSLALGAFLAGAVLSGSSLSGRAGEDLLTLTDLFAVLFFVAVGMLLDPSVLVRAPVQIAAILAVILVAKSFAAIGIVRLLGGSRTTGLVVGAGLAQIGEFSFIVATSAIAIGLLPDRGFQLVVAAALLSIAVNPLLFRLVLAIDHRSGERPASSAAVAG
jgi:K+:H+ antiporter